jgi:hypothetical protein
MFVMNGGYSTCLTQLVIMSATYTNETRNRHRHYILYGIDMQLETKITITNC